MFESCPYGTPLSDACKSYVLPWILAGLAVPVVCLLLITSAMVFLLPWASGHEYWTHMFAWVVERIISQFRHNQKKQYRDEDISMDMVTSNILAWLISNSEDREHVSVALQAISGATIVLPITPLWESGIERQILDCLRRCFSGSWKQGDLRLKPASSPRLACSYLRALSHLRVSDSTDGYGDDPWMVNGIFRRRAPVDELVAVYR